MKQKQKNTLRKAIVTIAIIALNTMYFPTVSAAALANISDIMTRIDNGIVSSHDITFDLDGSNTFATTETLTIDFDEDGGEFVVDGASSAIADFGFNDGTERTIVGVDGDCTGHSAANDVAVGINDTTGVVTFEACGSFSASGAGATVNIEYGTAAGGTNRVTNPAAATYVIDIGGTSGDDGKFAVAIAADDQVVVQTIIDPSITFTMTTTTVTLTTAAAGNPDASNTGYNNGAANTLAASTNATSGYSITYNGSTLTSSGDTIDAIGGTPAASSTGSEQFGLNLKDNATPNTGAEPSGGSGAPASDYNTADQFAYEISGAIALASAAGPTATTTYTASYIVNVAAQTEAGAYSTTVTYIATGNF